MPLSIKRLSNHLGAEVTGVDLSEPVTDDVRAALNRAWIEHAVLVVRGQSLTPPQFAAVAELFGEILQQQLTKFCVPDFPLVGTISSRDLPVRDGKLHVRGEQFHTDHSNFVAPPKGTMLHAVSLPDTGGDTQFVDVRAAFDDLPQGERERIGRLWSRHVYESTKSPRKMAELSPEELAKVPVTIQPLVIRHPESGRGALYLNTGRMEGIEGMDDQAAYALINALFAHATQAKYEYRHKWLKGDLVLWDNRSVMHQANADFDPSQYRFLYRLMLQGAPLVPYRARERATAQVA